MQRIIIKGDFYMYNKPIKLYNLIFPVYMLWLMPPVIFLAAILNFIIDSAVILITKKNFEYRKYIFKA